MLEFFSASGAGLCAALAVLVAQGFQHSAAARSFLALTLGALAYLLHGLTPSWLSNQSYMIQSMTPAFFWLSCRYIFQEKQKLPCYGVFIAGYSFLIPIASSVFHGALPQGNAVIILLTTEVPQVCEYILVALGLMEVAKDRQHDLVESRRKFRWGLMTAIGLSLGWSIISLQFEIGSAASRAILINLSLLIVIWFLFNSRGELWPNPLTSERTDISPASPCINQALKASTPSSISAPITESVISRDAISLIDTPDPAFTLSDLPKTSAELQVLDEAMSSGFYRRENLTLKALAVELSLPEYRVRAVINKQLGYRNFNEFINEYRITEAAARLRSEPNTPISNISLDIGYRTLSSFNRAFRKQHRMTPTEYRENNTHANA